MRAARRFLVSLKEKEFFEDIFSVQVELYGSLAMTGRGHATDIAILLGLEGETPEGVDPESIASRVENIRKKKTIKLFGRLEIGFNEETDLLFLRGKFLPFHSNAMRLKAYDRSGKLLGSELFYSVGGGFVVDHEEAMRKDPPKVEGCLPFPFKTAEELLKHTSLSQKAIWEIVLENEKEFRSEEQIRLGVFRIWSVMQESVKRGLSSTGELPGGLNVQRRAACCIKNF